MVGQWNATSKQDSITLGKNLGVKECICDSNGSEQKSEMKDVLSQVTMNSAIKNEILLKESNSEGSAISVPTDILSFWDCTLMRTGYINCMTTLAIHGNFVHQEIAEIARLCGSHMAHQKLYFTKNFTLTNFKSVY